jgi:lipoprotein-anchoring transpeptidase ErfK/SrfK
VVDLSRHELTLTLEGRYAGRFPIGVGRDQPNLEGAYTVHDKTANPTYRGSDGIQYNGGDPRNPLGSAWIGLTDRIGIHGSPNPQGIGRDDNRGSICVPNQQIQDLYGILSVGSRVTIVR